MGLLRKLTGGVDKKLLQTGVLGRGLITDLNLTGTTVQTGNGLTERACIFTVEVTLDDTPTFTATCKQRIAEILIPKINPGSSVVAVRVDPEDHNHIALDLHTDPPTVTMAAGSANGSAASVLASGTPGRAVIIASESLGTRPPRASTCAPSC